ncbi:hypothetical protein GM708_14115 [Vibrio cholerae]|nr:hypothetical protein [Vibrio cholerae]
MFASMDEAYSAVDGVLGCEADAIGDPIVPSDGGALTSEQKLCAENLQIDLYPDAKALEAGLDIWNGSTQGEVQLARGSNWMVVDLTGVVTGEPTSWDIEGLAGELDAEFSVVGD